MKLHLVTFLLIGYLSNLDNVDSSIIESLDLFSVELCKTITKNESRNVVLSPYSASVALGMMLLGAEGNTKKELLTALHLNDDKPFETLYEGLHNKLQTASSSEHIILNKAFITPKITIKQKYRNALTKYFHAEEEQVDFANAEQAANTVNKWVSRGTNDKINQILSDGDLDSNKTSMILTSVHYFKGKWQYEFRNFNYLSFISDNGHTSIVPGMRQPANVVYGIVPEVGARFAEIPFEGNNKLSMIIIVPNYGVGLDEVEEVINKMKISDLRKGGKSRKVVITMPKFKFERTIELKPILEKMGVKELFSDKANLRGISENSLKVDQIKQKVVIEVNEEGSRAAVAFGNRRTRQSTFASPTPFTIDRPFNFIIVKTMDKKDGIVLFSGNYKGPEYD